MDIEILEFIPEPKGFKVGYVDFKVTYSPTKNETFRQIAFFEKETQHWLSGAKTQREDKWVDRYERTPSIQPLYVEAMKALEDYLAARATESVTTKQTESDLKSADDLFGSF